MNGYQRVRSFLDGKPVDCIPSMPITMMFAADQIGRRYRDYVTDYRVLVEAQVETARKFGIDHVSSISDPTREAYDCGAEVIFFDNQPPSFNEKNALLKEKSTLKKLKVPDPMGGGRMTDRVEASRLFRKVVGGEKLIEGWVEGPMAEASDLRGVNAVMMDFFDDAEFVRDLFEFVVEMALRFAKCQISAGADLIGVGDAAASLVGPRIYKEFVWPYEKKLIDGLHEMGVPVRLHICGDTRPLLGEMGRLGAEIVDLDYVPSLSAGRAEMGPDQILLGNLDPVRLVLNGSVEQVHEELVNCRNAAGPRYIVGAGCEVPVGTPEANLQELDRFRRSLDR